MIVYDYRGIHRAKPITRRGWTRSSLFFSVSGSEEDGEKILINTAFLDRPDPRIQRFLRFGVPSTYRTFPETDASSLTFKETLRLQTQLLKSMPVYLKRDVVHNLPLDFLVKAKKLLGKTTDINTSKP